MKPPKFSTQNTHFNLAIKQRVQQYFEDNKMSPNGNFSLYFKAVFLLLLYIGLYVQMVFFTPPHLWICILECLLMGCVTAFVGFNVMHDGVHGSFSKSKIVNSLAGTTLNFLGASKLMWYNKHNLIHHTYTNVEGVDDDIEIQPFLRMCATQKRYKAHKYQHFYFWVLYCLLHILWVFKNDYEKYFKQKIGSIAIKKMSLKEHIGFWAAKVGYAFFMMAVPIYVLGFGKWVLGYLMVSMTTGFVISIVFQLAHTVEHTEFPMPNEITHKIENEWAIHQVETTANFATKNKLVSWLCGGLNFQIEHHLFPKISHVHYPAISKIIKETANEYGIKYVEYKRMYQAVWSHIKHLKNMGVLVAS